MNLSDIDNDNADEIITVAIAWDRGIHLVQWFRHWPLVQRSGGSNPGRPSIFSLISQTFTYSAVDSLASDRFVCQSTWVQFPLFLFNFVLTLRKLCTHTCDQANQSIHLFEVGKSVATISPGEGRVIMSNAVVGLRNLFAVIDTNNVPLVANTPWLWCCCQCLIGMTTHLALLFENFDSQL